MKLVSYPNKVSNVETQAKNNYAQVFFCYKNF